MQVVAVIVLAALIFIAANYYTSRLGLMWWVACTFVLSARSRIRLVAGEYAFRAVGAACIHRATASQPEW